MGEILHVVPLVNLKVGAEQTMRRGEKVFPPFSEQLRAEISANVKGISKTLKIVMKEEKSEKESTRKTEGETGEGKDKTESGKTEGDGKKEVNWTRLSAEYFERHVRENPDIADNDEARAKWDKFVESGKITSPWPYPAKTETELPSEPLTA